MKDRLFASTAALVLAFAGVAQAQDNMKKLENMQTTGTGSDAFQYVPQDDAITFWWFGAPDPGVPLARRDLSPRLLVPAHLTLLRAGH